jgi:hypothetical protein
MSIASPPLPGISHQKRRTVHRAHEDSSRLGVYTSPGCRDREIVSVPAAGGSTLVIDRDSLTRLDERLVAHLPADEPAANRHLVCTMYLADEKGRFCGHVTTEDRETTPPAVHVSSFAHTAATALDPEGIL